MIFSDSIGSENFVDECEDGFSFIRYHQSRLIGKPKCLECKTQEDVDQNHRVLTSLEVGKYIRNEVYCKVTELRWLEDKEL